MKTVGEKILVKRLYEKQVTDGGIFRPDASITPLSCGWVVALGERIQNKIDSGIIKGPKVGDLVFFAEAAAWDIPEFKDEGTLTAIFYNDITLWLPRDTALKKGYK